MCLRREYEEIEVQVPYFNKARWRRDSTTNSDCVRGLYVRCDLT